MELRRRSWFVQVGNEGSIAEIDEGVDCELKGKAYHVAAQLAKAEDMKGNLLETFKIDTGAALSVIRKEVLEKLGIQSLSEKEVYFGGDNTPNYVPAYFLYCRLDGKTLGPLEVIARVRSLLGMDVLGSFKVEMRNLTSMKITAL